MITKEEISESTKIIWKDKKSSIFWKSFSITVSIFAIDSYILHLLPNIIFLNPLYGIITFIIIAVIFYIGFFGYSVAIYVKNEYIPFKIINKKYWLEYVTKENNIFIQTPNILLNNQVRCIMEFKIKLEESAKNKLKRSRYSIIAYKPSTIELTISSKINKRELDPKPKSLENFFVLDQKYEENNNILSFIIEIEPGDIEDGSISLFFEYGSKFSLIDNTFEPNPRKLLSKEKIFLSKLTLDKK